MENRVNAKNQLTQYRSNNERKRKKLSHPENYWLSVIYAKVYPQRFKPPDPELYGYMADKSQ